jgi:fatty acid desaturase
MTDAVRNVDRARRQRADQETASQSVTRRQAERLATAIGVCRLLSLVGALLLWAAWSVAVFWGVLGFALLAGLAAVLLARLAMVKGMRIETACDLDPPAAE